MPTKKTFATKPNIEPLADRVLIENLPEPELPPPPGDLNLGGILVPGKSQAAIQAARSAHRGGDGYLISRVIAVGSTCKLVKPDDRILFARHHAFNAKPDETESTFIKETDIIAVVQ